MQHKVVTATWKSKEALDKMIHSYEKEDWSVVALGDVFGANLLVFSNDGHKYEHEVTPTLFKTQKKLEEIITNKEKDNWEVCAIGECFGNAITIFRRRLD